MTPPESSLQRPVLKKVPCRRNLRSAKVFCWVALAVDRPRGGFETMNDRKPGSGSMYNMADAKKPAKLNREIQAKLGQQLRAIYDDVVNQGVPDRFASLLDQLDKSDDKGKQ
jgi:hypothetical protein